MTELDGKSEDLVQDNIAALTRLFPEVACDGKVDFNKLRNLLGDAIDNASDRYNFTWHGKDAALRLSQTPSMGTLRPCKAQSKDWDTTQNLYIEGDNLEVLKLLQKSYHGRVKMIYIDPPYNTGNDFVYHDDFRDNLANYQRLTGQADEAGKVYTTNSETSGRYHTDWLNMIYPRLRLARNLLREDGVIFISIDDNEEGNLRKICDEVFGEENLLANIIWQHSIQPKGYLGKFSVHHNFILCYQKTSEFKLGAFERTDEDNKAYSNPDNDPKGPWRSGDVRNALYRPNLIYDIISPSGKVIKPCPNGWRWSKETVQEKIKTGEIIFSQDETRIIRKIYLSNLEGRAPETIWFGKDAGTTREAMGELKSLFERAPFDTPKPTRLIERMMDLIDDSSAIIMDFFSGSATTAAAVMKKNAEDNGTRRYILVQLPEQCPEESEAVREGYHNLCEIGEERIRRAGEQYNDKGVDVGFRVFQLDTSNI